MIIYFYYDYMSDEFTPRIRALFHMKQPHSLLYSLVVATALVNIWRGIWRLFDLYLLPEFPIASSITSIVIGVILLTITHHRLA